MKILISKTGKINGRGSDKYKWVSFLSKNERDAVRKGEVVLIEDTNTHYATTKYKQVYFASNRFSHRNYYEQKEQL